MPPWTPVGREAVEKAKTVMQDWTVRHKSHKGENCQGRQLRRKEDFAVTVLSKTNEEHVTLMLCPPKSMCDYQSIKASTDFGFLRSSLTGTINMDQIIFHLFSQLHVIEK